jgi:hypothetical protein
MNQPVRNNRLTVALYINAGLLALIVTILLARSGPPNMLPAAYAQNQLPIGGGAGVFIVPAQFASNVFGCYLMDIDAQTLCAYQFFPADKQLRLIAARNFRWDRRLTHFNTDLPTPEEVEQMIQQEQQGHRITDVNTEKGSPEKPKNQ